MGQLEYMNGVGIGSLNDGIESEYREMLNHLLEKAPSDAALKFDFSLSKNTYEGELKIISSRQNFHAFGSKRSPDELLCELVGNIGKQLLKWRNERNWSLR